MSLGRVGFLALLGVGFWHAASAQAQDVDGGVREQPSPYCPADAVGCALTDVDYEYHHDAFAGAGFDTGWVPSSGAIQLRFGLALSGSTDVTMGGTVVSSWPSAIGVQVFGRPDAGHLAMNYGVVLTARLRFHASILGASYSWEGDIPTPGFLSDLAAVAETTFDPFALPGDLLRPITISDSSARFALLSYGLTDDLIDIPGLSGGIAIDIQGSMATSYQSNSIVIANADEIVATDGRSRVFPEEGADGFGAAKDIVLHPNGTLAYDGTITLYPNVFIELLGFDFDYDIAEIPIRIGAGGMEVMFADDTAHVPLPDVDFSVMAVDFGDVEPAQTEHRPLTITNAGEAPLELSPRVVHGGFNAPMATLVVMPGESEDLDVSFLSTTHGRATANLQIDTNDPDQPLLFVRLAANVLGSDDAGVESDASTPDGGVGEPGFPPQSGGCGCDVPNGSSTTYPFVLVFLALSGVLVRQLRSRPRSRSRD